jgi:hypothetical protein
MEESVESEKERYAMMEIPESDMNGEMTEKNINRDYEHFRILAENTPEKLISFKEIIGQARIDAILPRLFELYPAESQFEPDYRNFYETIIKMDPNPEQNAYITVDKFLMDQEGETDEPPTIVSQDVLGYDVETGDPLNLEYFGWDIWLGFKADSDEVAEIGAETFLAHCFYKMTINGYTKEDIMANLERKSGDPKANKMIFGGKRNSVFPGINMANPLDPEGPDNETKKTPSTAREMIFVVALLVIAILIYMYLTGRGR